MTAGAIVGGPLATSGGRWALGLFLVLGHLALTLGLSSGLGRDELESMLFAQGWAWGYDVEQPPLYNWLQMAVTEAVGPSLAGSILLRWGIIVVGVLALYDAVRRMAGGDAALAAGALAGVGGTALFGFEGARHFTHTTLLLTATALILWTAVRVVERPGAGRFVALGAALAVGALSKYTIAVFVLALGLAALAEPATRAALLDRRVLWAAVAPLLAVPGHLIWRLGQDSSLTERVASITSRGEPVGWLEAMPGLLLNVVADPIAGMAPPLVLALALVPWRRVWGGRAEPTPGTPRWDRVLLVYVAAAMALTLAVVLASGGHRLRYHYLMPAALVMPAIPLLWMRARGLTLAPWRRRALGWGLVGLALVLLAGTAVHRAWIEPAGCGRCLPLLPADRAAEAVRAAGFSDGTIVAASLDWGANLRPAFPEARMLARHYPHWRPPGRPPGGVPGAGACLILLSPREAAALRDGALEADPIATTLTGMVGAAPPEGWLSSVTVRDLPLTLAPDRSVSFAFHLSPEGLGTCR
ncbi:glycosyltransferase family 39 protein [Roseospira navarrensis]|uniref:Glycosyltransferase RgtA/B/C/D-like domain-containing protein n=1 Tax=Roseospira navarrensis TaxID=140058 RepID=A0A7X2D303_9PROT|nr:glycosyltransferase family 39 protein [Roseospira navarrensis]MQX36308.1 hypothetical protein [Roseospira navarrensis]